MQRNIRFIVSTLLLCFAQFLNASQVQKEILEFSDERQFLEFSQEVDRLCAEDKLKLIDLPELLDLDPDSAELSVRFYQEVKTGNIWMLKQPKDSFQGSFVILPKAKKKNERIKVDTKGLYEELMLVWKKMVVGSLLLLAIGLAIYFFFWRA